MPGIFAAGNVVHVYDLVDWVTGAGAKPDAAPQCMLWASCPAGGACIAVRAGNNVRYVVPQRIDAQVLEQERHIAAIPCEPANRSAGLAGSGRGTGTPSRAAVFSTARPGEMLTLPLKPEMADGLHGAKEITIHVNER